MPDRKWTYVIANQAYGTAKYWWGRMGTNRNGPVDIAVAGSRGDPYHYTAMNITLTQSWYGTRPPGDHAPYPPYGHGRTTPSRTPASRSTTRPPT
jgi:hypothetical protein